MKRLYLLLSLFLPLNAVVAQSISIGTISKLALCTGDTVWVPYVSNGTFAGDNFFAVQLSDANGSFSTFTNIGHDISPNDSIPVRMGSAGDHYRVRIISTDPYTISYNTSSDIKIVDYPFPNPAPQISQTFLGYTSFVGDPVQLKDGSTESSGSTYLWKFDQDANTIWSTIPSPTVTYPSIGSKTGTLTVTNTTGCSTTKPFNLIVMSCSPVIPDTAHIVTGTESGSFSFVWVKAGGNYTTSGEFMMATVFVEPGGSLQTSFRSEGLFYIKSGASFIANNNQGHAIVILSPGDSIPVNFDVDTLHCDDLQFDYSQVGGGAGVPVAENPLHIQVNPNQLQVTDEGENISASIVNILGASLLSKSGRDNISLDFSSLANGIYFAIITSGDHREMRKIVVVH